MEKAFYEDVHRILLLINDLAGQAKEKIDSQVAQLGEQENGLSKVGWRMASVRDSNAEAVGVLEMWYRSLEGEHEDGEEGLGTDPGDPPEPA